MVLMLLVARTIEMQLEDEVVALTLKGIVDARARPPEPRPMPRV